jgi:hypothetical protein
MIYTSIISEIEKRINVLVLQGEAQEEEDEKEHEE